MFAAAAKSFLFGMTLAAAIGPIALLILSYGLSEGIRAGLAAGFGASLADLLWALVAFSAGSLLLPRVEQHLPLLRTACAVVLLVLGLWMIVRAIRKPPPAGVGTTPQRSSRPFVTTFVFTAVNPLTLVVFATFAVQLPASQSVFETLLFAASLAFGSLLVQTMLAAGGAGLGRLLTNPVWIRALNVASGIGVFAFGIVGLLQDRTA